MTKVLFVQSQISEGFKSIDNELIGMFKGEWASDYLAQSVNL